MEEKIEIRFKIDVELNQRIIKAKAKFELETGIQSSVNDWIVKAIKNQLQE